MTPWTVARQAPLSMGILQARILEWIVISSSSGSSQPRDRTHVSYTAGSFFAFRATREALGGGEWRPVPLCHCHSLELSGDEGTDSASCHWEMNRCRCQFLKVWGEGDGKRQPQGDLQDNSWIHLEIQVLYGNQEQCYCWLFFPIGEGIQPTSGVMVPVGIRFAA